MRTLVVGDVHGHGESFICLLKSVGAVNGIGERVDGWHVLQVGDLINGMVDSQEDDYFTLVECLPLIDVWILGNHDAPHVYPKAYFPQYMGKWAPLAAARSLISRAAESGKVKAATTAGSYLVTHAGLSDDVSAIGDLPSVKQMADYINKRLGWRCIQYNPDPLFDAVGKSRGGLDAHGGIFWEDWQMLKSTIPQIVGHTGQERGYAQRGNLWCIDGGRWYMTGCIVDGDDVQIVSVPIT